MTPCRDFAAAKPPKGVKGGQGLLRALREITQRLE